MLSESEISWENKLRSENLAFLFSLYDIGLQRYGMYGGLFLEQREHERSEIVSLKFREMQ